MKVLLDTSVLVAAMVEAHPHHQEALPWLQRARRGELTAVVASHTLAELYAVLTSLPVRPRISPSTAWHLIQENVLTTMEVVDLSTEDYRAVLEHLSTSSIAGGITYDALISHAALKAAAEQLVTLNPAHFRRIHPALSKQIVSP
ncbi:MAG: PIN domain-containing protein [Chloroflexi bacterium]|nr:PIN domain-containing protein [Chloroflexota bacterium]